MDAAELWQELGTVNESMVNLKAQLKEVSDKLSSAEPDEKARLQGKEEHLQRCLEQAYEQKTILLKAVTGPAHTAIQMPESPPPAAAPPAAGVLMVLPVARAAGSSAAHQILIKLDAAMLQAAMGGSHLQEEDEISEKSYALSNTNWDQAAEAAERLGWRLERYSDVQTESSRSVSAFNWLVDGREDDKANRDNIVKELKEQLQVPTYIDIVSIERELLIQYVGDHDNKRTKLRGKTDFVAVLAAECQHLQTCGAGSGLDYVVNFFETKTPKALDDDVNKCRGAAAAECLAANLSLQQAGVQLLPEGFPVVMTDMNRFFLYHQKPDEQVILEVSYQNKAVAYDALAKLLRRHAERVHTRHPQMRAAQHQTATASAATAAAGTDAAPASTSGDVAGALALEAELQSAEVADAACTIASQLKLQPTNPTGVKVYIEELGCAVARALKQRTAACSSGTGHSPDSSSQTSYVEVPEQFVHLYL